MAELKRTTAANGVVIYRSPALEALGVAHAFSTRLGGVSVGPFASLNLGNPNGATVQDPLENLATNYALLHAAAGLAGRERAYVHQVHGDVVHAARIGKSFDVNCKGDAVVTDDPARAAAVRVADCVPILLATADGRTVAAVHAGWRGVVAGVVDKAVESIRPSAGERLPIVAAVGPCIGFDAFEVGPEVAAEFEKAFGGDSCGLLKPSKNAGKAMVDLRSAVRLQLIGLGLAAKDVDLTDRCTVRDDDEFFSHRRENGVTGRMAAIIGPVG